MKNNEIRFVILGFYIKFVTNAQPNPLNNAISQKDRFQIEKYFSVGVMWKGTSSMGGFTSTKQSHIQT